MNKACNTCGQGFEISPEDSQFYDDVSPTFNGKKELIPPAIALPGLPLPTSPKFPQ